VALDYGYAYLADMRRCGQAICRLGPRVSSSSPSSTSSSSSSSLSIVADVAADAGDGFVVLVDGNDHDNNNANDNDANSEDDNNANDNDDAEDYVETSSSRRSVSTSTRVHRSIANVNS
jgi:hypothetical protein